MLINVMGVGVEGVWGDKGVVKQVDLYQAQS